MSLGSTMETVRKIKAQAPELERESSDMGTTITAREEERPSADQLWRPADACQAFHAISPRRDRTREFGWWPRWGTRLYTTSVSGGAVNAPPRCHSMAPTFPTADGFEEGDLRALQIPPDAISRIPETTSPPMSRPNSGRVRGWICRL